MGTSTSSLADRLFVEALDLEPALREDFLDTTCAERPDVRAEVEALLRASERAADYFEELPGRLGLEHLTDADADSDLHIGRQIGRYELTSRIASGGMGSVWRAERSDGRYESTVAIKLLDRLDDDASLQRFRLEANYLARLSHPNIARLIDAGVEGRQPYLVLDFIAGMPIDRYCDDHELSVDSRVALFLDVLAAVAHAHAHLIVHRDIKPANVLVTADGAVKLLDFGVAKLLSDDADSAGGLTRQLGAALTPEFAAPEQVMGASITTATDIYSLGLLLRLLLTGGTARDTASIRSVAQLCEIVTREPQKLIDSLGPQSQIPQLASRRRVTSLELARMLRGDLDGIVRKATAPEPAHRYATAGDFAADLARYLRHEPVIAQMPTLGYRTRKFFRRHRGGMLAAAFACIALLAAAIVTIWQGMEARRQRDAALYQQQRAQAANDFMSLVMEEVGPQGKPLTMLELLDRGEAMLDAQAAVRQPHVAATYYDLALRHAVLGQNDRALALLDRAQQLASQEGDSDVRAGALCAGAVIKGRDSPHQAQAQLATALALLKSMRAPSLETRIDCAQAQSRSLMENDQPEDAMRVLKEVLRAYAASGARASHRQAVLLNELSGIHYTRGAWAGALEYNGRALQVLESIGRGDTMLFLMLSLNRTQVLFATGQVVEAQRARDSLVARIGRLDAASQRPFWNAYAAGLIRLTRYQEAFEIVRQPQSDADPRGIAENGFLKGAALAHLGRPLEALAHLDAAESFYRRAPVAGQRLLGNVIATRAYSHLQTGDRDRAKRILTSGLDEIGYRPGEPAPNMKLLLQFGTLIALDANDVAGADQLSGDLVDLSMKAAADPALSADVGSALLLRAKSLRAGGNAVAALASVKRALPSLVNGLGEDHPEVREARELIAALR